MCVGRRDWSRDDFRNFLAHFPDLLSNFEEEKVFYVKLDIESDNYSLLKDRLIACNGHDLIGTIISHLCLSPEYFVTVAR